MITKEELKSRIERHFRNNKIDIFIKSCIINYLFDKAKYESKYIEEKALLSMIDIITPNETEAEILTGVRVSDEQSAVEAAQVFHKKGIDCVMITLGEKGVFVSQNGETRIINGFRVKAVDTTAAGDTFNGGFVTALLEGKSFENAVRFGQAAAAISVTRKGAQPSIPTRQETLEFLTHV